MKRFLWITALMAFTFAACEEVPPVIPDCQTQRVVLIEEFTGVQCVNCPTGSEKLGQLLEQYPGKLVAVSIHSGFFSVPYPDSPEDFTTVDGENIDAMLGPVTAYPSAIINRKLFGDENQLPLGLSSWSGYIASELCREPLLKVQTLVQYDSLTRRLEVEVTSLPNTTEALTEAVGLTVMLTEDEIVAPQASLHGKEQAYTHKHVLRGLLTNYAGKNMYAQGEVAEAKLERFVYTLPANLEARHCHVVAFLHYQGTSERAVLQADTRAVWE